MTDIEIKGDHTVPASFVKNHPDMVKRMLFFGPVFVITDDGDYGAVIGGGYLLETKDDVDAFCLRASNSFGLEGSYQISLWLCLLD